jgi:hypothetical protein
VLFKNLKTISVEDEQSARINAIRLFPNPASLSSQLILDNNYFGEIQIRIFNILGEEVFHSSAFKNIRTFSRKLVFNSLSNGIYILQTQMGTVVDTQKFIITNKH